MPLLQLPDLTCYYRLEGQDGKPVLVLSHSLGQDHGQWDPQIGDLASAFRVLRYDIRGHGASSVPAGDYRIEQLGRDVVALTDALNIETFAFCGVSLGGMIGQWLAISASDRLTRVVLANTSPRADGEAMETRRQAVRGGGMAAIADIVMGRLFSSRLVAGNPSAVATARRTLVATSAEGYAACCAAIRDMDHTASLGSIGVPTLVISGDLDVSLPWQGHGEILARDIPRAQALRLNTAHLSNVEAPRSFTAAVLDFLVAAAADQRAAGLQVRRQALGAAHVDRALLAADVLTKDFQELITRYVWGSIWTRPGLDHRTRRLLVLVITAALGRWEEFRLHVRAGLERELEPCDVREALLQTAVYAGVPAANTAFQIAAEVLSASRNMPSNEGERDEDH